LQEKLTLVKNPQRKRNQKPEDANTKTVPLSPFLEFAFLAGMNFRTIGA